MGNQTINDTSVNSQITDAVSQVNTTMLGTAASEAMGLIDLVTAETLGMSMHNAVTAQQNSQMSTTASVTASCAKMLQAQLPIPAPALPPKPDVPPPFLPLDPANPVSPATPADLIKEAAKFVAMAKAMQNKDEAIVKKDEVALNALDKTLESFAKNNPD